MICAQMVATTMLATTNVVGAWKSDTPTAATEMLPPIPLFAVPERTVMDPLLPPELLAVTRFTPPLVPAVPITIEIESFG